MLPQNAFYLGTNTALAIHVVLSAGIVALVIGAAALLRERRRPAVGDVSYESGVTPMERPKEPLNVPYFLIAALFVVFDMEAALLFAWAVVARQTGVPGFGEATVFIAVLLAALAYLWADGALDWGPKARR